MTDAFLTYQLSQLCQHAVDTCPFTNPVAGADCTRKFCSGFPAYIDEGTCVSLGYDPSNCCVSSDPTTCLQNFAHGSSGGSSGSGTPNVCASIISILDTCFTLTPSLSPSALVATSGPSATALASCACYDSNGTYDPNQFDNFASECQASGSAVHPTYFPLVTPLVGFCTNNAGAAAPGSVAASTTPPAITATASTPASSSAVGSTSSRQSAASLTSAGAGTTSSAASASLTSAGAGTTSSAASTSSAQTTASKSSGVKLTFRTTPILLLGFAMVFSFY